jgi:Flp pilus assembly secretin CpaC
VPGALLLAAVAAAPRAGGAQGAALSAGPIERLELVAGRSLPITGGAPISKVTVVNPEIADVVVISQTEVVLNALTPGETDVILWSDNAPRRHYRTVVRSSSERRQILLAVKFAEVRKEALRNISTSLLLRSADGSTRAGAGTFRSDGPIQQDGSVSLPAAARFLTVLSTFNTEELLGLLDAEETRGNARFLAEPNLMAANLEEASFLAGGEIPIPFVQGGAAGQQAFVTIQFREFGIRLNFKGEVLSDSLLKLTVQPEV